MSRLRIFLLLASSAYGQAAIVAHGVAHSTDTNPITTSGIACGKLEQQYFKDLTIVNHDAWLCQKDLSRLDRRLLAALKEELERS
jgi:hypothetical protein